VFWDRGTLYTFRALMSAGAVDQCMPYFSYYSATRLLGEHVPYAVEAWPEGGQRHLAAESALYCRVITEGLFNITPIGFKKFSISPRLPKNWKTMKLRNIKAFDKTFDIEVSQNGAMETIRIKLENGKILQQSWNKKQPVVFQLS
jgi:cellobiose phosphorylase